MDNLQIGSIDNNNHILDEFPDTKNFTELQRNKFLENEREFIRIVVDKYLKHLPLYLRDPIFSEELFNVCILKIVDLMKTYDPNKKITFNTYAEYGIRGAMTVHIRKLFDSLNAGGRKKVRKIKRALENNDKPSDSEIAANLGLTVYDYSFHKNFLEREGDDHYKRKQNTPISLSHLSDYFSDRRNNKTSDDFLEDKKGTAMLSERATKESRIKVLRQALEYYLSRLSTLGPVVSKEEYRKIFNLYLQGIPNIEIAKLLGLKEDRVRNVMYRLRQGFRSYFNKKGLTFEDF